MTRLLRMGREEEEEEDEEEEDEEGVEGGLVDECFNEPVGEEDRLCWPS